MLMIGREKRKSRCERIHNIERPNGEIGALVLLDMSAAFDAIDGIILDVLRRRFHVQDAALDWFNSYFTDRTKIVVSGTDSSAVRELKVGTPQGARSFIV